MSDKKLLKKTMDNVDTVILLAGLVGDPITRKYPKESVAINDKAVKTVIDTCDEEDVKRFILVSTCSNYGLIEGNNIAGEEYDLNPLSLYSKSKNIKVNDTKILNQNTSFMLRWKIIISTLNLDHPGS